MVPAAESQHHGDSTGQSVKEVLQPEPVGVQATQGKTRLGAVKELKLSYHNGYI